MNDLPPKSLKNQLVHLDRNLKDIERTKFAGIQRAPGSLPVLEAFQGFLEKERQIARRRLMTVSAIGIFMILLISGATTTFIYMQMKQMSVDYSTLSTQANTLESQLKTENKATQTQLATLNAYLNNNAANHTQLLTAHSNIATQATQDHKQITELQISLEDLARENIVLKRQINNIVQDWQSINQTTVGARPASPSEPLVRTTEGRAQTASSEQSSVQNTKPRITSPEPRTQNPASSSINLTIVPPGQDHGIRWRLPHITQ